MPKPKLNLESASGVDPARAAVLVLLGFVSLAAWLVWSSAGQARETLESKEAMVYLITGDGIQSDNAEAEADLAAAAQGLFTARRMALILFVGSGLVLAALLAGLIRPNNLSRPVGRIGPGDKPHDKSTPRRVNPARGTRRGTGYN